MKETLLVVALSSLYTWQRNKEDLYNCDARHTVSVGPVKRSNCRTKTSYISRFDAECAVRCRLQRGNAIRTDERQARNYVYSSLLTDVIIVLECQRCVLHSPLQRLRQIYQVGRRLV